MIRPKSDLKPIGTIIINVTMPQVHYSDTCGGRFSTEPLHYHIMRWRVIGHEETVHGWTEAVEFHSEEKIYLEETNLINKTLEAYLALAMEGVFADATRGLDSRDIAQQAFGNILKQVEYVLNLVQEETEA
jgi:hypothetical protein